MPSFDIQCELNHHEVANALDQANREVATRFDFKGTTATFELKDKTIVMRAEADFQLKQMMDILQNKLIKRQVDLGHLKPEDPILQLKKAEQTITLQEGIPTETAKEIVKELKTQKFKVQATIQGECVRVTGKQRDDLQTVIAFLKQYDSKLPLSFGNFRD